MLSGSAVYAQFHDCSATPCLTKAQGYNTELALPCAAYRHLGHCLFKHMQNGSVDRRELVLVKLQHKRRLKLECEFLVDVQLLIILAV